jgi:hypothetical protein
MNIFACIRSFVKECDIAITLILILTLKFILKFCLRIPAVTHEVSPSLIMLDLRGKVFKIFYALG